MRSSIWDGAAIKGSFSLSSLYAIIGLMIALLAAGALGAYCIYTTSIYAIPVVIGSLIMAIVVILRQDELAVIVIVAVRLYADMYLGQQFIGLVMALVLLLIFYLMRSPRHPWVKPTALWLWAIFLTLTIYPAIRGGSLSPLDAVIFYPGIILGSFMMFWLGIIVARNRACLRKFFKLFAGVGTLLAVHTIIQATTGTFLFVPTHYQTLLLQQESNYQLLGSNVDRAGSFFIDPNINGTFLAILFFLPLGLFIESSSLFEKGLYLAEMAFILPALLFTYSIGAWIGFLVGIISFVIFVGSTRNRILLPLFAFAVTVAMMLAFPSQISLLLTHAQGPDELSLRFGLWQTAIRVIYAFPLTGVGLSYQAYLLGAEPFRVPAQIVALGHPHNAYLELGAEAGLPVLVVFLALIVHALWRARRNWTLAEARTRALIGGGIASVIALSINSISINGWTYYPFAAMTWLILGTISSPLLAKSLSSEITQKKKS